MKVVFMGTPAFAVPSLEAVAARHQVVQVISQPDRPVGRGAAVTAPPVAAWATAHDVQLWQPRSMRPPEVAETLRAHAADVAVVVAYGKLLPPAVLTAFRLGCVNVHGSLLPRHRGAAPVQRAILDGDAETGVAIMQLDEGMDTGPVFHTVRTPIGPRETAGELMARLATLGADALVAVLDDLARGVAVATPQAEVGATHARMLEKAEGECGFDRPATVVSAHVRGVDPWPGAVASRAGVALKLFGASVGADRPADAAVGQVVRIDAAGAHVACADGVVIIAELQLAGRKRMAAAQLAAGRAIAVGDVLTRPAAAS